MDAPAALINAHRAESLALDSQVSAAVAGVFRQVSLADASASAGLLRRFIPDIVVPLSEVATTGAAVFYDEARAAAGAGGAFAARTVPGATADQIDGMIRWASAPLFAAEPSVPASLARATGGAQRLVREADRETVRSASHDDPQSYGWRRIAAPDACKFCVALSDRGGVYRRGTVDFAAHDNCRCVAAPTWDENAREVQPRAYTASQRTTSMSETQRRRHRAEIRGWLNRDYPNLPG